MRTPQNWQFTGCREGHLLVSFGLLPVDKFSAISETRQTWVNQKGSMRMVNTTFKWSGMQVLHWGMDVKLITNYERIREKKLRAFFSSFSFILTPLATSYCYCYSIPMWTQDPMKKGSSVCVAVNGITDARQPVALLSTPSASNFLFGQSNEGHVSPYNHWWTWKES